MSGGIKTLGSYLCVELYVLLVLSSLYRKLENVENTEPELQQSAVSAVSTQQDIYPSLIYVAVPQGDQSCSVHVKQCQCNLKQIC